MAKFNRYTKKKKSKKRRTYKKRRSHYGQKRSMGYEHAYMIGTSEGVTYKKIPSAPKLAMPSPSMKFTFKTCSIGEIDKLAQFNMTLAVVKANSIFNPFEEAPLSGAEKPHYKDEWAEFYDDQKCYSALLLFKLTSQLNIDDLRIAIIPLRSATVLANTLAYDALCDYPRIHWGRTLSGENTNGHLSFAARTVKISYKVSIKSMYQGTAFSNQQFQSTTSADPSQEVFFHVIICNNNGELLSAGTDALAYQADLYTRTILSKRDT